MARFPGFLDADEASFPVPESFFRVVLPLVQDLGELKLILYLLRRFSTLRGTPVPWLTADELAADAELVRVLGGSGSTDLMMALARAVEDGLLLQGEWVRGDGVVELRYFLNTPAGQAALTAMQRGAPLSRGEVTERPDVFTLYEQTIGILTPLIADELRDAEATYPAAWIEEAFREAVRLNKRNWKYIRAILERWRTEGRDETHRRHRQSTRRTGPQEDFSDIIKR